MRWLCVWAHIVGVCGLFPGRAPDEGDVRHMYPLTTVAVALHNDAHLLPFLFGWLENVEWPKGRLSVELYVLDGGSEDASVEMSQWWMDTVHRPKLFAHLQLHHTVTENWMELALRAARLRSSSRVLFLDGTSILTELKLLQILAKPANVSGEAPTSTGDAVVVAVLPPTRDRQEWNVVGGEGEGRVRLDAAALPLYMDLTHDDASYLTFEADNLAYYEGDRSPLVVLFESARRMGVRLVGERRGGMGWYLPTLDHMQHQRALCRSVLVDLIADGREDALPVSRAVRPWRMEPETLGFDKIYLINLARRPDRLSRMSRMLEVLGVDWTLWQASDGAALPAEYPWTALPGYMDPFHNRPIKAGEVGCMLSHYRIWEDVVKRNLKRVLVFEDDVRFAEDFRRGIEEMVEDLEKTGQEWDLVYLGRKKEGKEREMWVDGHRRLSTVVYSYWTVGYALSNQGAHKLLDGRPLENMIPVDEYLPIMYDQHPNEEWKRHWYKRDLKAFTLYPLLVSPQRYTNEPGYVSDTEASVIVDELKAGLEKAGQLARQVKEHIEQMGKDEL